MKISDDKNTDDMGTRTIYAVRFLFYGGTFPAAIWL